MLRAPEKLNKLPKIALLALYGIDNIGIRSLAAVLRSSGFETEIMFFKRWYNNEALEPTEQELSLVVDFLEAKRIDIVGLSFTSPFVDVARAVTRKIKERLEALVIWGGIHATVDANGCLQHCDLVVRGEGEGALLELVQRLAARKPIRDVGNLSLLVKGKPIHNPLRPLIKDLDQLPLPIYGGPGIQWVDGDLHPGEPLATAHEVRIFASRGCPYSCSYCYAGIFRDLYPGQPSQRRKSPQAVIAEITATLGRLPRVRKIKFDDDTFFFPRAWVAAFADLYVERIGLPFEILYNAGSFDEQTLTVLRKAGLRRIQVGIQAGSSRENLEVYKRRLELKQTFRLAETCHKLGIETVYDVILDNPLATAEDRDSLLDLLLRLPRPFDLFVYSLNVFPGTALFRLFVEKGLIRAEQAEAVAAKARRQFRYDFDFPRSREELIFGCIVSLTSKSFIPKSAIRLLYKSPAIRRYPALLKTLALSANTAKLASMAFKMSIRGELGIVKMREYGTRRRLLIQ